MFTTSATFSFSSITTISQFKTFVETKEEEEKEQRTL